jgi:hypothetical protein
MANTTGQQSYYPKVDPSVPDAVRYHLQLIYEKLNNHAQAFSMIGAAAGGKGKTVIINGGQSSPVTPPAPPPPPVLSIGAVNNQSGVTSYTTSPTDNTALLVLSSPTGIAVTLSTSIKSPWIVFVTNQGTGNATITPQSGTISYANNPGAASMPLNGGSSAIIAFDGTNFWAFTEPSGGGTFSRTPHIVTGTRSLNTIYQNTTGTEMIVTGWATTRGSSVGHLNALVGVTSPPLLAVWGNEYTATISAGFAGFNFTVPNNYFYQITSSGAITGVGNWIEYY